MAITRISCKQFIEQSKQHLLLDVRSPSEFAHAHMPGAINLPLFTDEERKVVGTLYKQKSKEAAIKEGLVFFGVKMKSMIEVVEQLLATADLSDKKTLFVHCWRGGMRSAGVAWLLDLYGYKVFTLQGGYKAYRQTILQCFEQNLPLKILGGQTGTGKTEILLALKQASAATVDLEALAHHRGSSFGAIGQSTPPTQEQFENNLALFLQEALSLNKPIWLEDESQRIGNVNIPKALWLQMRNAPLYYLDLPFEIRLDRIVVDYGCFETEHLIAATERIKKRLGGLDCQRSIDFLTAANFKEAFRILLLYYDKHYWLATQKRSATSVHNIKFEQFDLPLILKKLLHV
jgi:tRNA 2-selenouridine synthase